MAYTPERWACDFCTNEIKRGDKRVKIEVPLTTAEKRALAAEYEQAAPQPVRSMLGLAMVSLVPEAYNVLCCLPCFNAIMPDAVNLRATKVAEIVATVQRARQQSPEEEEA